MVKKFAKVFNPLLPLKYNGSIVDDGLAHLWDKDSDGVESNSESI